MIASGPLSVHHEVLLPCCPFGARPLRSWPCYRPGCQHRAQSTVMMMGKSAPLHLCQLGLSATDHRAQTLKRHMQEFLLIKLAPVLCSGFCLELRIETGWTVFNSLQPPSCLYSFLPRLTTLNICLPKENCLC